MARVPPFELDMDERRALLEPLRVDMSIAVVRAKNPFNIGAMIRVAHSYLVREVFLVGTESYYERAAMGMQRYENIVECPDEADLLVALGGRPPIAIERDHADTTLWQAEFPPDTVFLFGSENDGLPESLLAAATTVVAIPMYGVNHSFPVSISCGMVLCEWARRRDPRGTPNLAGERRGRYRSLA
ncbi:MAG: TrmH family RNA methyltransferase [Myxococcota bacterium]